MYIPLPHQNGRHKVQTVVNMLNKYHTDVGLFLILILNTCKNIECNFLSDPKPNFQGTGQT